MFGLAVAESSHYISFGGLIHKNCIDEADAVLESQFRFLLGWLRTTDKNQKCQAVLTFNPPSTAEGRWLLDFFGAWLNPQHHNPAMPGELRWYATVKGGVEVERPDGKEFIESGETIRPKSRTFIPARVTDNPYLMATDYVAQLQSLREPLRSQLLYGDMQAGLTDDAWQLIPTAWVQAAMDRWTPIPPLFEGKPCPVQCLGVDVARGGADSTCFAARHGLWVDRLIRFPGRETPDGLIVANLVSGELAKRGVTHCPVNIDVIGVGSSAYDFCRLKHIRATPINNGSKTEKMDSAHQNEFANVRAWSYWHFYELLNPNNPHPISLPPDKQLLADLTAPRWRPGPPIRIELKEDIVKRLMRSPDSADAVILAFIPVQSSTMGLPSLGTGKHGNVMDDMPQSVFQNRQEQTKTHSFDRRDDDPEDFRPAGGGSMDKKW